MAVGARFDDGIVGAGIVGLAHAYHLSKAGRKVAVFERHPKACGASVRNFGMIWPIGQVAGEAYRLARRSTDLWRSVLEQAGLWHDPCGCLHLAYRDDEVAVLSEFVDAIGGPERDCRMLTPGAIGAKSPAVRRDGLLAGMWSSHEICVDPREVVGKLPEWLAREFGVTFHFGAAANGYEDGVVNTSIGAFGVSNLFVCGGDELRGLFAAQIAPLGLFPCKLQMMRTAPMRAGWKLGPMLAAGLTLRHYKAFADCPSLPALAKRVAVENPEFDRFGIHVMTAQNGQGELVLGDSHEYGRDIEPFDKNEIDEAVLRYLGTFLETPDLRIAARWNGVYVKHPTATHVVLRPAENLRAVVGLGGAGMTLSFAVAENVVREFLE